MATERIITRDIAAPIPPRAKLDNKERDLQIAQMFLQQKKAYPLASTADCVRGLSAKFEVSEATVRRVLRDTFKDSREGGMV